MIVYVYGKLVLHIDSWDGYIKKINGIIVFLCQDEPDIMVI